MADEEVKKQEARIVQSYVTHGMDMVHYLSAPLRAMESILSSFVHDRTTTGFSALDHAQDALGQSLGKALVSIRTAWDSSQTGTKWQTFRHNTTFDFLKHLDIPFEHTNQCLDEMEDIAVAAGLIAVGSVTGRIVKTMIPKSEPLSMYPSKEIVPGVYWRGVNKTPNFHFEHGFTSKGTRLDYRAYRKHIQESSVPQYSGLISASSEFEVARWFPLSSQKKGPISWVYEIHSNRITCISDMISESEHLFKLYIKPTEIKGAWKIMDSPALNDRVVIPYSYVPNPHFKPIRISKQTSSTIHAVVLNAGQKGSQIAHSLSSNDTIQAHWVGNPARYEDLSLTSPVLSSDAESSVLETASTKCTLMDIGNACGNVVSKVLGIDATMEEMNQVKEFILDIASNSEQTPVKMISRLLQAPVDHINSIMTSPERFCTIVANITTANTVDQALVGCTAAVGQVLNFLNNVSWICEFCKCPKEKLIGLVTSPYQVVKQCFQLCRALLKHPMQTCKMLIKSIVHFPRDTIRRFCRAVGLKRKKKHKHTEIPLAQPVMSAEELEKRLLQFATDLSVLHFLARAKGFIDPYLTIEEYHSSLLQDWQWVNRNDLPKSYFDFPAFLVDKMEQNSLTYLNLFSPHAHPHQPLFLPVCLDILNSIHSQLATASCVSNELEDCLKHVDTETTERCISPTILTESHETVLIPTNPQQESRLFIKDLEKSHALLVDLVNEQKQSIHLVTQLGNHSISMKALNISVRVNARLASRRTLE